MDTQVTSDGHARCAWCTATDGYISYHDDDWGWPVSDDQKLFEKLTLESFQSGLSWRTILEKRDGFKTCFTNFDFHKIAQFDDRDVERLVLDASIVRHRGKITATINNANLAIAAQQDYGSLARYLWSFADPNDLGSGTEQRSTSPAAQAMSKQMKKDGWKFFGPTTAYAFMQAAGMVNDHAVGCVNRDAATKAQAEFDRP
ncbi:DNA-3-methyladenine glycosylase I [Marivivens niveibacter]|uniref:DNA-3-methyladenine glycosylase I n=1 Tax=Marivivens niveibacter TaxID=1930667 RepID=UPI0019808173|nr:DNA-3-methyladenine glycosylase I [Marivivens niveibacter]